jgi:hypothetical protein
MKKASKWIIFFFIFLSIQANAQIVNEIISYVDSTELIVNNGRKFLLNRISVHDNDKAKEIYQYLTHYTKGKKYAAFDYSEEIYIHLLMGDWQALTSQMMNYELRVNRASDPKKEEIISLLHEKVAKASDSLLLACRQSELDSESQRVTGILLYLIKAGYPDYQYNKLLKEFRKEYKKSAYDGFILGYLPPLKVKSALSFSLGSGAIAFDNKLKESFSPYASINLSMDINYNRLFTSLYLNTAALKLKTPFTIFSDKDTTSFYQNDSFSYLDGGLKVGYFLIRSDRFHVAPYVTIGGSVLESDIYDYNQMEDAEFRVLNSFTFGPALHTEVKLFEYKSTDAMGITRSKYFSLKLEGGYNYITNIDFPEFKGNVAYINVALAWGSGYF